MKRKKLVIIIAIILVGILSVTSILGYHYYRTKILNKSKEHYQKAEALYG